MFDWNDQELANILWGEAHDSDDHTVPYPSGSEQIPLDVSGNRIKKGWNEDIVNEKQFKDNPVLLSELNRVKGEKKIECDKNEGLSAAGSSVDSGNALSLSSMSKSYQDSMDEPAKLYNGTQIFQNPNVDKDSDLIGYGWDNIGSFEDLDRIFSSDDPKFGCTSLGNSDVLWSSSKDISSSPEKRDYLSMDFSTLGSGAPSISDQCGKTVDILDQVQPFATINNNMSDLTYPHDGHADMDRLRDTELKKNLFMADKMTRQKNMLRRHKTSGEESQARPYQDLSKTWFSDENQFMQLEGQDAKTGQSRAFLGINQKMKFHEIAPLPYNNVTTPLFSPSGHTSMQIQDLVTPISPQCCSGFEVPLGKSPTLNESAGSPANPLTMTPQEKIKKLKRRQQLRAMLAIQKQQEQFGHQTSESEHSICQKHTFVDQMQPIRGNLAVDNVTSTILTLDAISPLEQNYSGKMTMATDDCSAENEILNRLQDTVAKLDVQLRLCIRDSLCRLAQSATQRQYAKDASSTMRRSENFLEFFPEEETNTDSRSAITPEAETDTNQIDRTVAHLLFHRPIEFSGKSETAESAACTKLAICAEVKMSKNISSCMNTSEYASNCEAEQEGVTKVEASH